MERKLAAILSADVQGYSRLMGDDEEATIRTLTAYREVMTNLIQQHRGRVVDSPGDNLLAEFASAVDAVQGAVKIQKDLKTRNAGLPARRQMHYRIGINVGDVVVEGERIYGDGVNIAARLESLADGGGIAISGTVYDQVKNKLSLGYAYQGEQTVKNIADPVRMYKVELEAEAAAATMGAEPPTELPLPDKPSIAVLPFTNMSNDPEQEYFSDGMSDDIITDLSKISGLFVIARNSTFTYKGQAVEVGEVSKRLGVRYVLEGSVRKAENRVRINVQLIDALTGGHVWAERYDRELKDIFALQDAVTEQIVSALQVKLTPGEQERLARSPTDNVEAYDYFLRGWEAYWQMTQATNHRARQAFERAITLDPTYAAAYAVLAQTYTAEWVLQWSADTQSLERAFELAQRAVALDDTLSTGHMALGEVYTWRRQLAASIAEGERAVALDPNDADSYALLAGALNTAGQPEQALRAGEQAIRLNPRYPARYAFFLGNAHWLLRHREKAVAALQQAVRRNPDYLSPHLNLAALYSELGEEEAAHVEVAEILRINPHFTLAVWQERLPNPAFAERWQAGLRKAGLE